jgi:hypothetical protein
MHTQAQTRTHIHTNTNTHAHKHTHTQGPALVDAGALSLSPAVVNGMDKDRIHFASKDVNPFYPVVWQVRVVVSYSSAIEVVVEVGW